MKVYFTSSLWCKGKGFWGFSQRTNWQFEYKGAKCYIPAVYRFSGGIVFDVITILDEIKLRKFFEKYEDIEATLTPLQRRCLEQEHPYQAIPISEIWINGKQVIDGYSSSSAMSIPWIGQDEKLTFVQKAYSSILKDVTCFACERFCVPYPPADSKIQKLLRFLRMDKVSGIKLLTYPVKRFIPLDIHFEMSVDEKEKQLCFNHPITGIKHILYFQGADFIELPVEASGNRNLYILQSMYEIEPALPQGDNLQFGSSIDKLLEITDDKFMPASSASIGIIGGADGPTSIFISSKEDEKPQPHGLHGLPLHSCYCVPSFQKEDTFHFVLEGINIKDCDSKEYNFQ